ncbi:hypothetical protein [Streptomyces yaizuensis]|uniref:Uncharacterized protein n=1 Tax=Streptomyces yaizuensis TaxID=2989713 RepID=A0ABQ5P6N7_9ACTN|nr:hypothetical protein [Streptomyces sp. YSPA8]GLF98227.1 hypothetical protein SYYSPA8_28040 [Streptomyces sp. YSPA8]
MFTRPGRVPGDLALVLGPVAGLWAGVGRASTCRWLAAAVRTELARVRGLVGGEVAERVLAERLERRLLLERGRPVVGLQGWLMSRGLPQRPGCWSHVCDDGVRMDTGGGCASCDSLVGDRRAVRRAVAVEVAQEMPGVSAEVRRGEAERRLHHQVQVRAAADAVRHKRAAAERAVREEAVERRRRERAVAERERVSAPCEECGVAEAAGLCLVCSARRRTGELLREAVDVTVALRADLGDRAAVGELTERVAADTRLLLDGVCGRSAGVPEAAVLAFDQSTVAGRILAGRRAAALKRLAGGEEAEAEAERAFEAAMRRQHRYPTRGMALSAAQKAADAAREAAAGALLRERLGDLARLRGRPVAERAGWRVRCGERAGRPPAGDAAAGAGGLVGMGRVGAA